MKCKILLILSLVAICYSYPYGTGVGKSVIINDDGTIVVTRAGGMGITINKGIGSSGQSLDQDQLKQEWKWGRRQGMTGGQNQVSVLDLLRGKAIEQELQQQGQLSQVGQPSQVAVNVPIGVDEQGRRVVETVVVPRSQVTTGLGQWGLSDTKGLWGNQQLGGITGITRTPWRARGHLTAGQLGQSRWGQVGGINEPMSSILEEVIEEEREILNQQRQIQQLEQEWNWGRQQGVSGQNQVSVLDLLHEQAIEQELQQQAQLSQVGQSSQVAVNVPKGVDEQGRQVVETVVVPRSQVTTGLGQWGLSDTRGLWGNQQLGGITGITRTSLGVRGLLAAEQLAQSRWSQFGGINEPTSAILEEVIEAKREILDQQRQIQQQKLQQQETLGQQFIQQKEQHQQQLQQQLMQQLTGGNSLLQGGWPGIQTRGQLSLWQQQPGVPSKELFGGYGQNIPVFQTNWRPSDSLKRHKE